MHSPDNLSKLYIEITTACNLDCQMCVRRSWDEPIGHMAVDTFHSLMVDLSNLSRPPTIHLSGYGEPMSHPQFLELVQLAKATGGSVEVTTNGMLLDKEMAEALVDLFLHGICIDRSPSGNVIKERT